MRAALAGFLPALALACVSATASTSSPPPIVFAASADSALPLAEIQDGVLTSGILKELEEAIAAKLGREVHYLTLPRNRLDAALADGTVDGLCYVTPGWLAAPVHWTAPLIPNEDLLVGAADTAAPRALSTIAGQRIGMVLGYKYPEFDAALGSRYIRDNSPSMPLNLKKLAAGRYRYAVVDRLSLQYQARMVPQLSGLPTLAISRFDARCAFSRASKLPFPEVERAVQQLVKEKRVEQILSHYR